MGQERLVGLALLNIHTNIAVNPKKLADEFVNAEQIRVFHFGIPGYPDFSQQ